MEHDNFRLTQATAEYLSIILSDVSIQKVLSPLDAVHEYDVLNSNGDPSVLIEECKSQ